jgi:hypothetical protein
MTINRPCHRGDRSYAYCGISFILNMKHTPLVSGFIPVFVKLKGIGIHPYAVASDDVLQATASFRLLHSPELNAVDPVPACAALVKNFES